MKKFYLDCHRWDLWYENAGILKSKRPVHVYYSHNEFSASSLSGIKNEVERQFS